LFVLKFAFAYSFKELLVFFFFFKAKKGSRETAPLKLPVDGLALLLLEPEYERHPVRTCRWRYIARQPFLWQQTKTKLHFCYNDTFYRVEIRRREGLFYLCECISQILVSFTSVE
jgi:hypothetical protein